MANTNSHSPVLMIALDSAEPRLIEQWIEDGTLPNLKRLRTLGGYGRLASSAKWMAGSPWPTFYTASTPADHGVYHAVQWRADQMKYAPITPDWKPLQPFWRSLGKVGRRVIALDLPMTFPPEPFDGLEVYSLVNRDLLGSERVPASHPPSLFEDLRREFNFEDNPVGDEIYNMQHIKALFRLRDQLIWGTRLVTDIAQTLMKREKWDLFMVNLMATHRGGHKLWNLSGSWETVGEGKSFDALRDVYIAVDEAVGRLASTAGMGVTLLVFSLHGMRPNADRSCLLPEMLRRILSKETNHGKVEQSPYLQPLQMLWQVLIRDHLSSDTRFLVSRRPPFSWLWKYGWLMLTKKGKIDWATTPAFAIEADLQGYVRINLRGREALGVVEQGKEYDQLCSKIAEGLATFVDADTKESLVESVKRSHQLFGNGNQLKDLPDLIVQWNPSPAAKLRAVVSHRYGSIPWTLPGRHPTGRSGNHGPEGFLLIVEKAVKQSSKIKDANILDLAPTVCALLKVPVPVEMHGNVIEL